MMQVKVEINGVLVGFVSVTNIATLTDDESRYRARGTRINQVGAPLVASGVDVQHRGGDGAFELAAKVLRAVDKDMKEKGGG